MSLVYDLHSHSTASDGSLAPAELVARAHALGVGVLALTDHDTTDGIAEAQAAADALGVTLAPGVEVSVTWHGVEVHVLGLGVDPGAPGLQAGLAALREARVRRALEMERRLESAGIAGAYEGARALAKGRVVNRTHFARFLVARGYARDQRDVFKRFLTRNRPGHVPGEWAAMEDALGWIKEAGGQAVLAHPARYRLTGTRLRQLLEAFRESGGEGLEVVSGSHNPDDVRLMAGYARRYGFLASCGSDYHGPESPWTELGRLPPFPDGCVPVWTVWEDAGPGLRATTA